MRQNLLSFFIGLTFIGLIFTVYETFIKSESGGYAFASPAGFIGQDNDANRKYLLRTISYHPDNLLKVMGQDVQTVLKEPELVRSERPTIVWQYRNEVCVLDVYFATMEEDPLYAPVVHYEVRARDSAVPDDTMQERCVRDLVREKGSGLRMVDVSAFYKSPGL